MMLKSSSSSDDDDDDNETPRRRLSFKFSDDDDFALCSLNFLFGELDETVLVLCAALVVGVAMSLT